MSEIKGDGMKRMTFPVVALMILFSAFAASTAIADVEIKPYGFARLDMIYNDSRTNNGQITMWTNPETGAANKKKDDAELAIHPRLTRLGLNVKGGKLGNADITGNVEVDFQTTTNFSESRQAIRMRHAYLKLTSGDVHLLAGQTWDVISPIFPSVNQDTLMWNAGNLGDRRPQLRLGYEPSFGAGKLSFVAGLGLTNAVDGKDLDGNGVRDGEDAAAPNIQARAGASFKGFVEKENIVVGVWGHTAKEEMADGNTVGGEDSFTSSSMGADFTIPVISLLTVRGEVWTGKNLSDFRGGIGQGVNTTTGKEIESTGGWLELLCKLNPKFQASIGYTKDEPEEDDVTATGKTENETWYVGGLYKPGAGLAFGLEYINWKTEYKDNTDGDDNRINLIAQYNF